MLGAGWTLADFGDVLPDFGGQIIDVMGIPGIVPVDSAALRNGCGGAAKEEQKSQRQGSDCHSTLLASDASTIGSSSKAWRIRLHATLSQFEKRDFRVGEASSHVPLVLPNDAGITQDCLLGVTGLGHSNGEKPGIGFALRDQDDFDEPSALRQPPLRAVSGRSFSKRAGSACVAAPRCHCSNPSR